MEKLPEISVCKACGKRFSNIYCFRSAYCPDCRREIYHASGLKRIQKWQSSIDALKQSFSLSGDNFDDRTKAILDPIQLKEANDSIDKLEKIFGDEIELLNEMRIKITAQLSSLCFSDNNTSLYPSLLETYNSLFVSDFSDGPIYSALYDFFVREQASKLANELNTGKDYFGYLDKQENKLLRKYKPLFHQFKPSIYLLSGWIKMKPAKGGMPGTGVRSFLKLAKTTLDNMAIREFSKQFNIIKDETK